jgi:hypothetical protein
LSDTMMERYKPYLKRNGKRRIRFREGTFLKSTYEWLKWKITRIGGFAYHTPYLKQ